MAKRYADRIFVSINGFEQVNLVSFNMSRNQNLTRVETMNRSKRTAGFKSGNLAINGSFETELERDKAALDIALADPDSNIEIVAEAGGDRYTITGVEESDMSMAGSVGSATKTTNWEALDIVNENGDPVNVDLAL